MMRTAWIGLAMGAAAIAAPALANDNNQLMTAASTSQGMAAIEAKEPARAIEIVKPVIAGFERDLASEKRQVFCAINSQQSAAYLAQAAQDHRAATTVGVDWCRAQYVNAYALIDLGRFDEARTAFERLVGYAPQNARYLNELGFVLTKQRNWTGALTVYRRAAEAADLSLDRAVRERCLALKGAGYAQVEMGDLVGAAASYRQCLALDPADTDAPRELDYIRQQWRATA